MAVQVGDSIPEVSLKVLGEQGPADISTSEIFSGKKVVLFAVPGAFTPTCSAAHLPGFVASADKIKEKGVDAIVCVSVNDPFVMKAWGDIHGTDGKIDMIADPHAEFARALGLAVHMGPILGERATRCAMIIDDGVLTKMMMEEVGAYEVSSPTHVITQL